MNNENNNENLKYYQGGETLSKINDVNKFFKLPIFYNENHLISKNIIDDLELIKTIDPSCNPIYNYIFNINNNQNQDNIEKPIIEQISSYYTTDIKFLKDNQKLLKYYKNEKSLLNKNAQGGETLLNQSQNLINIWNDIKIDNGFKEKYFFVEWDSLQFLNKSEMFLQFMSLYNLISPVISLIIPIIILIIPFFILKLKGLNITIEEYIKILKLLAYQNAIGKLFVVNLREIPFQEKLYIIISAFFYLFSIYQNFNICYRFFNNMKVIHKYLNEIKYYLNDTINSMDNYLNFTQNLESKGHQIFNNNLREKQAKLKIIFEKINYISDWKLQLSNITKIGEIGYILKWFYELHSNNEYDELILFSLGFNGYIKCINGLQTNIQNKYINFIRFTNKNKKSIFNKSYYAPLKNNTINNTIKLKKNIIITGPNASGKTTILKSTIINIILSQQFGCGNYENGLLKPYHYIHCYLNIPDTSGRDSLFQAEARRCKEILDSIKEHKNANHFCAFDELYSGTNPEEAELSATSFINYITKNNNISFILTTHFINVCKSLENEKSLQNYKMKCTKDDKDIIKYYYILEKGISKIKGGLNILKQMNYPREILNFTK